MSGKDHARARKLVNLLRNAAREWGVVTHRKPECIPQSKKAVDEAERELAEFLQAAEQRIADLESCRKRDENGMIVGLPSDHHFGNHILRRDTARLLQAAEDREQILREALQQIVYEYEQATHAPTFATLAYKAAQDTLNEMEVKR